MLRKTLFLLVLLAFNSCSRLDLEKGGWVPPAYQKSKLMETLVGVFATVNSKFEIKFYLEVKVLDKRDRWVIVNFEDPQNRGNFLQKIYPISAGDDKIKIVSDPVYGVRNFQSYKVKILLSDDKDGKNIVDSLEQYVRAYRIPRLFISYNNTPSNGKNFYVSGKKEAEEYKIKRYSHDVISFFPDEAKSKNFDVINAGFWIYYDVPKGSPYVTPYKNSNLVVRYEYSLNRKSTFKQKVYQRAIIENPEDRNKPFIYESTLEAKEKASKVFHAPVENITMGKKYKLTFEFYSDEKRMKLIERVTQEIRSPIGNTKGCIKVMPELLYFMPEPSKWLCD